MLLLSLIDPQWPDARYSTGAATWQRVSYRQLGERLGEALWKDREFDREVLAHEAQFLLRLDDLFERAGVHDVDEPFQLPVEYRQPLVRANLADGVGKARASQVMRLIRQRLQKENVPPPAWRPEIGFTNGQPLLAIFWDKGDGVIVGWQYQGGQWRVAMILSREGLEGRGLHEARATFARQHMEGYSQLIA